MVVEPQSLQSLSAQELRELTTRLMTQLGHQSALLDKLTHENALLKRMKFAAQSARALQPRAEELARRRDPPASD